MKKFYLNNLLTALLLLCCTAATAHDFEVDGIYYNIEDATAKTVEVTYKGDYYATYDEYSGAVNIPATVKYNGKTYSVTTIGENAFGLCYNLKSVTIPNSVTCINGDAFTHCTGLTSVTIPTKVTYIGHYAFFGCTSLTSLAIPGSVTFIGNEAFRCCSNLTSIIVAEGNKVFDSRNNCNAIIETSTHTLIVGSNNTIIPNGVKCIGFGAFDGCSGLTSVTLPGSVRSFESDAFDNCSNLTTIISLIPAEDLFGYDTNWLGGVNPEALTLYVPYGAKKTYEETRGWWEFTNIVEMDPTSIDKIDTGAESTITYDLNGRSVSNPTKGIYIVNGKKVVF